MYASIQGALFNGADLIMIASYPAPDPLVRPRILGAAHVMTFIFPSSENLSCLTTLGADRIMIVSNGINV